MRRAFLAAPVGLDQYPEMGCDSDEKQQAATHWREHSILADEQPSKKVKNHGRKWKRVV